MRSCYSRFVLLIAVAMLAPLHGAMALEGAVTEARVAAGTKTPAVKTVTNFTQALRCMDELFLAYDKSGIVITSGGIPDETGKVRAGTKEMLLTAVSKMSLKSKAFDFIDLTRSDESLAWMTELKQGVTRVPDYYIRGSITQLDDSAVRKSKGWGISLPFLDFGSGDDQSYDLISLDISVGESASRRILPETSTSNTMVIHKGGKSREVGGRLGKVGLSFNMDLSQSEGLGAATRALLELTLIESLGMFTRVPYWKCLEIESTNPMMMSQAREWYDVAKEPDRVLFIQRKLAGMNRYNGPIDGKLSEDLKNAIAEYQAAVNLIADGRINFDLYYSLLDDTQNKLAELPRAVRSEGGTALSHTPQLAVDPMGALGAATKVSAAPGSAFRLHLNSERGQRPTYRVGEFLNLTLSATGTGTAYCYYEDAHRSVARIFPNQFYANSVVRAAPVVHLPSGGFKIKFDRAGRERVACVASDRDIVTPGNLSGAPDLTPLAVKSVDELVGQYRQLNPAVVVSVLDITVQPAQ